MLFYKTCITVHFINIVRHDYARVRPTERTVVFAVFTGRRGTRILTVCRLIIAEVLKPLLDAQLLDMVAMDIKNSRDFYADTTGVHEASFELERIEKSISLLLQSGIRHEFRTTVTKELHGAEQIRGIGLWLSGLAGKVFSTNVLSSPYYLQNFKNSGDLVCGSATAFHPLEEEELDRFISILKPYIPNTKIRGQ